MTTRDPRQDVAMAMARNGLQPNAEDMAYLAGVYERYVQRVNLLHRPELEGEEVAGLFEPAGPTPK